MSPGSPSVARGWLQGTGPSAGAARQPPRRDLRPHGRRVAGGATGQQVQQGNGGVVPNRARENRAMVNGDVVLISSILRGQSSQT